ncbi:hypothetical protein IWW34DRAFT_789549 [Fusarium oxysporum f. sp. albedinis]|nr:hypothetical protein IWW34DRAFT_789549 [Fusarium oxysporum f. sp. albedinis]
MVSHSPESFVKKFCAEVREGMQPYRKQELLTVVTYQLPVPCGDCSVHLLINEKGETLSAFITDGGRDARKLKASHVVHAGLWLIAKIHEIKRPYLRAWVVTTGIKIITRESSNSSKLGTLKDFVFMEDLSLYCATNKKTEKAASEALKDSDIQAIIKIGSNVIGYNFFGQKSNESGVGFWCVGGDGYSYTKGFQLPPKPLEEQNLRNNIDKGKPRYSYFCAGDGNVLLEKRNIYLVVFDNGTAKAFKLNHHGSSREFSGGEVLECMKLPRRLIVTPGHQYGHPCWDALFQTSKLYKQASRNDGDKLLYTTHLRYWVDESRFGKWSNRDVNINHERLMTIDSTKASGRYTGLLSGNEAAKAFDIEEDDEDESEDPDYIYEDYLTDFLAEVVKSKGASYESIYDRVTEELKAAVNEGKQGKLDMKERKVKSQGDMEEEKPSKPVDEMMEDKYEVVTACVDMWNSISEQKIREQVPQTAHYLLQMVSANDNELDGVIRAYEWPEIRDWQPKAHF